MRLIDAEPIENELFKKADVADSKNPYKQIKIALYRQVFEMIRNAPTENAMSVAYSQLKNDAQRAFFDRLIKAATVEVTEVVRCHECIHHTDEEPGMVYCPAVMGDWVGNEFYCGAGERKENGNVRTTD